MNFNFFLIQLRFLLCLYSQYTNSSTWARHVAVGEILSFFCFRGFSAEMLRGFRSWQLAFLSNSSLYIWNDKSLGRRIPFASEMMNRKPVLPVWALWHASLYTDVQDLMFYTTNSVFNTKKIIRPSLLQSVRFVSITNSVYFRVLPCTSVYFRVLPCTSVYFRVLPCTSVYFRVPCWNAFDSFIYQFLTFLQDLFLDIEDGFVSLSCLDDVVQCGFWFIL